jgi:cytochrome c-type biogenesis protein CcmF
MIAELGQFALSLALIAAVAQALLSLLGAHRVDARWMAAGARASVLQALSLGVAFGVLLWSHAVDDFSVRNVAENGHRLKPMLYKLAGAWGNHEGSMLLWILVLAAFGAAVALRGRQLPATLRARVVGVQGLIGVGFVLFVVAASNPLARLVPAPFEGNDLNPILQDPALAAHPPFLYLGYVGFSVAFSFAIAALLEGRVDPAWARWVRPWTLAAWCCLTLGIALGSWWAYYELGWGGWWFWDPVENASLMPWLSGTALLHSAVVVEKRDALKSWTVLLAILTFALSLVGTFLVRSGVLSSVHAFAVDPARGVFVLALLALTVGGALTLYAWRAPQLKLGGLFRPISREGALVLNNLLLTTACATVFVGTLYPLFLDATQGRSVSVGPPFYLRSFTPLMVALLVAMAAGPLLAWKRGDLAAALQRLWLALLALLLVASLTWYVQGGGPWLALVGFGLGAWTVAGAATDLAERVRLFRVPLSSSAARFAQLPRNAIGAALAHAGLGIAVIGMTGSALWQSERVLTMRAGEQVELAGYTLTFEGVRSVPGPNYVAERGSFAVRLRNGDAVATLAPERRFYPSQRTTTTEAAIRTTGLADLYVVIGEAAKDASGADATVVRVWHHPFVPWIWGGALVMVAGGLLSLADRRLRVGAPRARTSNAVVAS